MYKHKVICIVLIVTEFSGMWFRNKSRRKLYMIVSELYRNFIILENHNACDFTFALPADFIILLHVGGWIGNFHCVAAVNWLLLFFNFNNFGCLTKWGYNYNILNFIPGKSTDLMALCFTNKEPAFWLKWRVNQLSSLDHPEIQVTSLNLKWKCLNWKTFHRVSLF